MQPAQTHSHRSTDGLHSYLQAIGRFPKLDRGAELALARRFRRDGDEKAAHTLLEANLRYVPMIAARYRHYGIPRCDLIEEGNVGLLEAVRRFDPSRGFRLMTYATFWIRAFMRALIVRHWSVVRLGSSSIHASMFFRLHAERLRLSQTCDAEGLDVDGELARRFGTTPKRVRAMTDRLCGHDVSLDAPLPQQDSTMLDLLADTTPNGEVLVAERERREHVRRLVASAVQMLDSRERMILDTRVMARDDGASLADLGRRLGLSRERVRQLEVRVKTKLRTALEPFFGDAAGP
jgi:RNA polymerase sigma-32 factor